MESDSGDEGDHMQPFAEIQSFGDEAFGIGIERDVGNDVCGQAN